MNPKLDSYLSILEGRNGYCSCAQMQGLFRMRKEAERLEGICEHFRAERNAGGETEKDIPFLKDYQAKARELERASEEYHRELYNYAQTKRVIFRLHDPVARGVLGTIDYDGIVASLRDSDLIITMHCASCNQQVDLVRQP